MGGLGDQRRRTRAGLTLVEVLVVLAVIGVVAAMVVLGVRTDGDPARVEANRFADRLRLAADEALIAGRPVTLAMDPRGYGFEGDAHADDDWGARHDLPREVRFWAPQARLTVDPDGVEAPVVMTMRDRRQAWRITFDGLSAEVAPLGTEAG
ncbi:MAG: GspH/FimT family pseudopilin [Caulobacteraceae bacterium]|nr:GspH/FimT family pseudopilin [Caulobacteraceae bacterium]